MTSQLDEAQDRLLSLNQLLENQLQGSEAMIKSLKFQLSEVENRNKLFTGDHDALRNITLEQCDELILSSHHNQEKLLQRRVSNKTYLSYEHCYMIAHSLYAFIFIGHFDK